MLAAGAGAAACASGCGDRATDGDPADLHGVFDPSARVAASASAAATGSASAGRPVASASASPAPGPAEARDPADASGCVSEAGAPDASISRTVGRPACGAAEVLEWRDPSGAPRYACLYAARGGADRGPLPLVVYFHGTGAGLDDPAGLAKLTKLRERQESQPLDPDKPGFNIVAVQGRAVLGGKLGTTFDTAHVSRDNLDVAAADHFVDVVSERGLVDDKRIYAMGMGRGGTMAISYAMLRADRVAAFSVYAPLVPTAKWSCDGPPPPGFVAYRACDAVASCEDLESWLLARDDARAETGRLRLGEADADEPSCSVKNRCSKKKGDAHHLRWPKGREKDLLNFLAQHRMK
jgi:hypothetical protein